MDVPAVDVKGGGLRLQFHSGVEIVQRRQQVAGQRQRHAAAVERLGIHGIELERLAIIGSGPVELFALDESSAPGAEIRGVDRVEIDGGIEVVDRGFEIADGKVTVAALEQGFAQRRIDFQRFAESVDGGRELAATSISAAALDQGARLRRLVHKAYCNAFIRRLRRRV